MFERKGDHQYIRGLNDQMVMDLIFRRVKETRAEISRLTGLSKPTVSASVQRLIDKGWIQEAGRGENVIGRKATMLEFNYAAHCVCGIEVGASRIQIALARLDRSIMEYDQFRIPDTSPDAVLHEVFERVQQLITRHGVSFEQVSYIAIGMPAVVLPETGDISLIVPGLERFEQVLSLQSLAGIFPSKVVIENDINLAAIAEQDAAARDSNLFAYLSIGAGVGVGLVVEGRLLKGFGGAAGELGQMLIGQGIRMEDVLSLGGLMKRTEERLLADRQDSLLRGYSELTPAQLFDAVRHGDALASSVIESYCSFLAMAIHNLNVVAAPELIIVGGEVGNEGADVLIPILETLADTRFVTRPRLIGSVLGEKAIVLGAVNIAAQQAYNQIRDELAN